MVKILNDVYYHILFDTPMLPPETGGILGSENCVITKYFQDMESDNCRMGHYVPSIAVLNKQIKIWYEQNIIGNTAQLQNSTKSSIIRIWTDK